MARLSNKSNLGYVPFPSSKERVEMGEEAWGSRDKDNMVAMVASYIKPRKGVRYLDFCAGEGHVAQLMAHHLDIPKSNLYLNEIHEGRAEACKPIADNVLCDDAMHGVIAEKGGFGIVWANPPFDDDSLALNGTGHKRLEHWFLTEAIERKHWLQPGGVIVIVVPSYVMERETMMNHIYRCYDNVRIRVLPEEWRKFGEVVVMGVLRDTQRTAADVRGAVKLFKKKYENGYPVLDYAPEPVYTPPEPRKYKKLTWRCNEDATPENAQLDVLATGGAWNTKDYRNALLKARTPAVALRPLFPLSKVQAAFRIAAGQINGKVLKLRGRMVQIKGTTMETVRTWKEQETSEAAVTTVTHNLTVRIPLVVTVDMEDFVVRQYSGDEGMSKLMESEEDAKALIDAVTETAPPVYDMSAIPEDIEAVLDTVVSHSGRKLPGEKKPGYKTMQKHLISAVVDGLRKPDPTTGKPWDSINLVASPGCGKTSMGAGIAETLRVLAPTNISTTPLTRSKWKSKKTLVSATERRAFTVLVTAPNHLIGDGEALRSHDIYHGVGEDAWKKIYGKRARKPRSVWEISQWSAEWRDLLPDWHTEIIETPAQAASFFRHAQRNPEQPHVAFLALSKMCLASGRQVGAQRGVNASQYGAREFVIEAANNEINRFDNLVERIKEDAKWAAKGKKRTIKIDEARQKAGVSQRTFERDRMFHAGLHRQEPIGRFGPAYSEDHWFCTKCGGLLRKLNGDPFEWEKDIKKAHRRLICLNCKEIASGMGRRYDSVGDRKLGVFAQAAEYVEETVTVPTVIDWEDYGEVVPMFVGVTRNEKGAFRAALDDEGNPIRRTDGGRPLSTSVDRRRPVVRYHVEQRRALPGERPMSNPRIPVGEYIAQNWAHLIDVYGADEAHKHKGEDTDQGGVYRKLVKRARRHVAMTGTLYGGKASSVRALLYGQGDKTLSAMYTWNQRNDFISDLGVVDVVNREKTSTNSNSVSGRTTTTTETVERAGITAKLAEIIQQRAAVVRLAQMGFKLPNYLEDIDISLRLPPDMQAMYDEVMREGKALIGTPGGHDALGSYLQTLLAWPVTPWTPMRIWSKNLKAGVDVPTLSSDLILPHHERLTDIIIDEASRGRRVLIFVQHTNHYDVIDDVIRKCTAIAAERGVTIKGAAMRSQRVKGHQRIGWFADREADGTNFAVLHPALVETGLNLIGWQRVEFIEPTYNLYQAMQARCRPMRPTQTQDVEVWWSAYGDTMMDKALDVIGRKALAAELLAGDDLSSGLLASDPGMSLLKELAKKVMSGDTTSSESARDNFRKLGQVTREHMEASDDFAGVRAETAEALEAVIEEIATAPMPEEVVELAAATGIAAEELDALITDSALILAEQPEQTAEELAKSFFGDTPFRAVRPKRKRGAPVPTSLAFQGMLFTDE